MSPVTASSRFVDGGEFGFGAEIGRVLSTANACAANRGPRLVEVESLDSTCASWAGAAGAGELIASGEIAGKNEATSSRPYAPLNPFPRNDNSVRRRPATRARPRSGGASTLVRRQAAEAHGGCSTLFWPCRRSPPWWGGYVNDHMFRNCGPYGPMTRTPQPPATSPGSSRSSAKGPGRCSRRPP